MDIYSILASKPHNPHYVLKYTRFIEYCKLQNYGLTKKDCYLEEHHICPKAADLFPEYGSFTQYSWNKVLLTPRQHFIAHRMLWKAFGGSQRDAFWKMNHKVPSNRIGYRKIDSKSYQVLKEEKGRATSRQFSGENNPSKNPAVIAKIVAKTTGQKRTIESRTKMSQIQKAMKRSPESNEKRSRTQSGMYTMIDIRTGEKVRVKAGTRAEFLVVPRLYRN